MAEEDPRAPIRLRAEYSTALKTVAEVTRAISKGGMTLQSRNPLPVGTRFELELCSPELPDTRLRLVGEVTAVREQADVDGAPRYGLLIEYRFATDEERTRVQSAIERILHMNPQDRRREHPRVPSAYKVIEAGDFSPQWTIRNLSEGGLLLECDTPQTGRADAVVGTRARLEIGAGGRRFEILATIVWVMGAQEKAGIHAQMGLQFDPGVRQIISDMMSLRVMPDEVRIRFGGDGP